MFSTVCETTVPSTTGRFSRGRPVRRATISARAGSPRRAGSVEDISTPIIVARIESASLIRAFGSAAWRIAYQENAAHHHRRAHRRESQQNEGRLRVDQRLADARDPDLLERLEGERQRPERDQRHSGPSRGARSCCGADSSAVSGRSRLSSRGRAHARLQVGWREAGADAQRLRSSLRRRHRNRVRVGLHHLQRNPLPGEALHGRSCAAAPTAGAVRARDRARAATRPAPARRLAGTRIPSTPSVTTSR